MNLRSALWILVCLALPPRVHAAIKLGGGLPLDRGTDGTGWCPSTHPSFGGSGPFDGAFTADGPSISVRFTASIFHFDDPGWRWMRQRIDNVVLVTQSTYNAYLDSLACGASVDYNLPTLFFNRVPPGQSLYFEQFQTSLPSAWDTSRYAFYVSGGCSGGPCSAPNNLDNPTYTGGSLGLGQASDPHDALAVTGITIGGLTLGENYNLAFWWTSAGDQGKEGELVVDILGTEFWADVSNGPLPNPGSGQGVAWGDFDLDGDPDIFVSSNTLNQLYRNDGAGVFVDRSATLGFGTMQGRGVCWVDYDNDGDLDLYLMVAGGPNKLMRNDGGGTFVSAASGLLVSNDPSTQPFDGAQAWADYDGDGDLDVFMIVSLPPSFFGRLLRNDGPTSFVDVSAGTVLQNIYTSGTWGDFDNDGDPDLFAPSVVTGRILRNDSGQFVNVPAPDLLGDNGAWGDCDNDGDLDLYVCRSGTGVNGRLVRNDGGAGFVAVDAGTMTNHATGVVWLDADLDTDLDLLVTTNDANRLLLNEGNGSFVDGITEGPLAERTNGGGSGVADMDGDGDPDLFEAVFLADPSKNRLIRNDYADLLPQRRWLRVDLRGGESNRFGVGAQIRVVTGTTRQLREVTAGSGYLSQNDLTAQFGLGGADHADSVIVRWPSGTVQVLTNVAARQRITVTEPAQTAVPERGEPGVSAGFRRLAIVPNPFRTLTRVRYDLSEPSAVALRVYDYSGRLVRVLVHGVEPAGTHEVSWDGTDGWGRTLPAGIYFVRIDGMGAAEARKIIRIPGR